VGLDQTTATLTGQSSYAVRGPIIYTYKPYWKKDHNLINTLQ